MRYGDEDTVQQALSFIEKRDGTSDAISAKLDRDLTDALAALDKEFAAEDEKEDSRLDDSQSEKLRSYVANTPAVNKLRFVKNTLNFDFLNRIDLYLSTAEVFQSSRFATKARNIFTQYEGIEKNYCQCAMVADRVWIHMCHRRWSLSKTVQAVI